MNRVPCFDIRPARPSEFPDIGKLMVAVYSQLDGFPRPHEQPQYYEMLANIGLQTEKPDTELLVAATPDGRLLGAVVYFADMSQYGSGGTATQERDASGFRLLAVAGDARGTGVGKALSMACIDRARNRGHSKVVIHTTSAMQTAWRMYERLGFERADDLDFIQQELPVFGFRKYLQESDS